MPGRADDRDQAAVLLGDRPLQHPFELGEGVPAADERSVQSRGRIGSARGGRAGGTHAIGVVLALELERRQRARLSTALAHEPIRRLGEQDLARLGVLLEAGGAFAASPATKLRSGTMPFPATVPVLMPVRVASATP